MRRALTTIIALLFGSGLLAFAAFLSSQELDQANQWVTVVGFFVSALLAAIGIIIAYLTWSEQRKARSTPGMIRQENKGGRNVANTGQMGRNRTSRRTRMNPAISGDINQANSGGSNIANTGSMDHGEI